MRAIFKVTLMFTDFFEVILEIKAKMHLPT